MANAATFGSWPLCQKIKILRRWRRGNGKLCSFGGGGARGGSDGSSRLRRAGCGKAHPAETPSPAAGAAVGIVPLSLHQLVLGLEIPISGGGGQPPRGAAVANPQQLASPARHRARRGELPAGTPPRQPPGSVLWPGCGAGSPRPALPPPRGATRVWVRLREITADLGAGLGGGGAPERGAPRDGLWWRRVAEQDGDTRWDPISPPLPGARGHPEQIFLGSPLR